MRRDTGMIYRRGNSVLLRGFRGLLFFLVIFSAASHAQVYKWVDENGKVHFGDSPPEAANAQAVDLPAGPSEKQVEQAQQELQQTLEARQQSDAVSTAAASDDVVTPTGPQPVPDFACYTPIEDVLRGPTRAAYTPIQPTEVTEAQKAKARSVLALAKGRWRGTAVELNCSGQVDAPRSQVLHFTVNSMGTWKPKESLLVLANSASGSRDRVSETRNSFIAVSDALYFFEAPGDSGATVQRTMAQRGNQAEGLYLDDISLAFMINRRNFNVWQRELRLLVVDGRKLTYTELYFHQNILTGSRVWSVSRY
ncbi:MAG: DUF4124 domain-containing protein [Halioglobus sp.]